MNLWRVHAASAGAWRRAFLVCAIACATPGIAYAETLRQAVEAALTNHPRVLAAAAQQRSVEHEVAQARAGYFPTVDLNLADGKERTDTPQTRALGNSTTDLMRREAGITVVQNLFNGKATSSEVERQRARLDAATSRLAEIREEIALKAIEVYLDVYNNRELVKLANDNLGSHLGIQDKVRQRVQGGVSQRTDFQQAQGRVALAKSVVSARGGRLRQAEANYRTVVGRMPGDLTQQEIKPPTSLETGAIDAVRLTQTIKLESEAAFRTNPTLGIANAEIAAAEASVRNARSNYYPRVNIEATASRNQNIAGIKGDYDSEALMLVLRWNLFRGGADRAQERSFIERRYAAIDLAANTRRDVEEKVSLALNAKATSEERLESLRDHVKYSAEALAAYQQQLELGRRTLLDVLNAENELFTARSNLAAGIYEDLLNQYAVEAAKGTLVKSIGVTLAD